MINSHSEKNIQMSDNPFSFILPDWVRHMNRPICTIDIHPSGQYFATGGWDNYAKIWSFPALSSDKKVKDKLIAILHDHNGPVNCVRFSPDGKYLATCSDDSMVYIWQRIRCFGKPSTFGVPDSALTPNKPIQRWTSRSLSSVETRDVTGISWSPDSTHLVSCTVAGYVIMWDVKTGTHIWKTTLSSGCKSIAYDPLGRYIAVQMNTKRITILDTNGSIIKEIKDKLEDDVEQTITSHISWTADGSFLGAPNGFFDSNITPFFQRESFNFAFSLEGHVQPSSCVACPPFLLRIDNTLCSLTAVADIKGVLSIWLIGDQTKPLLILNGISASACNDACWSHDGQWLLIALESDPVICKGGIVAIHFKDLFSSIIEKHADIVDPSELEEVRMGLLGDATFHSRTQQTQKVKMILQSLEHTEKEVDMEVLQLTTEEVLARQVQTVKDRVTWIKPVLLTAVERQTVSHTCRVTLYEPPRDILDELYHAPQNEQELVDEDEKKDKKAKMEREKMEKEMKEAKKKENRIRREKEVKEALERRTAALRSTPIEWIPEGFNWPTPAALPDKVVEYFVQPKCVIVASGNQILKLSKETGRRLASPYALEIKCRHLSLYNDTILAVGENCHLIDINTMTGIFQASAPPSFSAFQLVNDTEIVGRAEGISFIYDKASESWRGGVLTRDEEDLSLAEIEAISKKDEVENAVEEWYDFGQSVIFSAYTGNIQKAEEFMHQMKESNTSEQSKLYVSNLERVVKSFTE